MAYIAIEQLPKDSYKRQCCGLGLLINNKVTIVNPDQEPLIVYLCRGCIGNLISKKGRTDAYTSEPVDTRIFHMWPKQYQRLLPPMPEYETNDTTLQR